MPYSSYEQFDFKVPVGTTGDNYDRFRVRIDEMRESLKIVEQALDGLPEGPYITDDRKVALPPRHELATSMEALIHHFKLVTEGFRVPPGETYVAIESPRGELGCYVLADGSAKPARVHMRDPSFVNLQACPRWRRTRCSPTSSPAWRCSTRSSAGWTGERRSVRQPALALPPAGTRPSASTSDPATIPDPADVDVPPELRAEIERHMANTPTATRPRCRRWTRPSACTAGARPRRSSQVAAVMQVTPAFLSSVATFYDMLRTAPGRAPLRLRLHQRRLPPAERQGGVRGDPRAGRRAGARGRRAARVRVPGRVRHGADGVDRRPLRRTAHRARRGRARVRPDRGPRAVPRARPVGSRLRAARTRLRAAGAADGAGRPPRGRHVGGPPGAGRPRGGRAARDAGRCRRSRSTPAPAWRPSPRRRASDRDAPAAREHRRAGSQHHRRLRAPGRLQVAAQGAARDDAGDVLPELENSGLRGRGGAGFSMGKKASLHPQGHDGQVPLLQRRRVRAGHLQGPPADAEEPAHADRGLRDRLDRGGRQQGLHLHPRRVLGAGGHPRRGRRRGLREGLPGRAASSARTTASTWSSTAARAPTSAARRPACSTRSRASAATRA